MLGFETINILSNVIQKDPGFIVGPISWVLGLITNLIFKFVYLFTTKHSLGISIILLTIIAKALMLPLAFKQQRSMYLMQKIQPEIKKIQDKYKDKLNQADTRQKMNVEINKIYSKYNYNPFSGCLPIFIQLPIFIALYYIMQNPYQFINVIGNIYNEIANKIIQAPNFSDVIVPLATPLVPKTMTIDVANVIDLQKVLNKFTPENWEVVKTSLSSINIDTLLSQKDSIEYFIGINLTERVGFSLPKVLIAIFSGLTTFFSSWLMTKKTKDSGAEQMVQTQQKVMLIVMPIIMTYVTTNLPAGVGLYWISSNVIQIIQQIFLNKYYEKKFLVNEKLN